ncbi:MAG: DUF4468 domain-containing protein [Bacteroidales bacterium]|nr:DUF4468 domain-containing protein [Bacteroidales bacterium]
MRKIFFAIIAMALPMMMNAQSVGLLARKPRVTAANLSSYAEKGAIPEENGKVVFKKTVAAMAGLSKEDIFNRMQQWAALRYEPNSMVGYDYQDPNFHKNLEYAKLKVADRQNGIIECQGAEELIFSVKPLAKNYTQAFYLLDVKVNQGSVDFTLHTINFNIDQGDNEFVRMDAESWITDAEAINKKGELRKRQGKFRVKTIDLVNQIESEIANAIQNE